MTHMSPRSFPHRVRGGVLVAVAVLAILAVSGTRAAAEGSDPETFRTLDVGDGRVTFDVVDAPFADVVKERIQPATRVNIVVSADAAAQRVTFRIVELHWVQALDALAEQIGGILVRKATNLLRVERPTPVNYDFTNEDVRSVIMTIATFAGANVLISDDVKGTITLTLKDTPWRESLEQIVRTVGFALVEESYGILRVVALEKLDLESGYYRFRYIRPPAPYRGVIPDQKASSGAGSGGGSAGGDVIQSDVWIPTDDPKEQEKNFPIIQALRNIVSREAGEVTYLPGMNAVLFSGTKPKIQALRQMVEQLDVEPPQVFIDMNFIVTSNSDALDLGLANAGQNGLGFGFQGADILHGLPFDFGGTGGDMASGITGTGFPSPAAGSFGFGTLNFSATQFLYQFLQRDTSSTIVQAPKLLALDNEEATIFIGESVRYARTTASTNQNGGLTFAIEEDPNSPVNVGFQLLVIPHVIPGEDKIMMLVIPQRKDLTGTGPVAGFDRITVGGQSIDLPRVQSTTLKTALILKTGETAVIGGLLRDRNSETVDKIPLLGDIPLLGLAFQGRSKRCTKEHLLITITPRILKGTDAASCTIDDELSGGSKRVESEWRDIYGRSMATYPEAPCAPVRSQVGPPPAMVSPMPPPPPSRPLPVAPGR
jgi:type II secretory pathway component GspD/PulD (secretin)